VERNIVLPPEIEIFHTRTNSRLVRRRRSSSEANIAHEDRHHLKTNGPLFCFSAFWVNVGAVRPSFAPLRRPVTQRAPRDPRSRQRKRSCAGAGMAPSLDDAPGFSRTVTRRAPPRATRQQSANLNGSGPRPLQNSFARVPARPLRRPSAGDNWVSSTSRWWVDNHIGRPMIAPEWSDLTHPRHAATTNVSDLRRNRTGA